MRIIITLLIVFMLSACTTTQTRDPQLLQTLASISVHEVDVRYSSAVNLGMPSLDGKTPEKSFDEVATTLTKVLKRNIIGYPGGATPVRLIVTINTADVGSGIGRVLVRSDSSLVGFVSIVSLKGNHVLATSPLLVGKDNAFHMGGNIGGPIGLVANIATAVGEERTEKVSEAFAAEVKRWLTPQ